MSSNKQPQSWCCLIHRGADNDDDDDDGGDDVDDDDDNDNDDDDDDNDNDDDNCDSLTQLCMFVNVANSPHVLSLH